MKTKVLTFCNHKGGVGKTTSVVNISGVLASKGFRVLVIDLDAQSNLTTSLYEVNENERNMYQALKSRKDLPIVKLTDNLHLAPSSLDLASIETEIGGQIGRERALAELIEPIKNNYDFILIDCAPTLSLLLINALATTDKVYIPMTAETLSYRGLVSLENVIEQAKQYLNNKIEIGGIFFTRWNGRNLNINIEEVARETYGDIILETKVRENISIAEAPIYKQNICDYQPKSNGAKDYTLLAEEILTRECSKV